MKESVKSINLCKSVVQTTYGIVKAHGSELKLKTKEGEVLHLLFNYPLFNLL